ncbi:MAG: nuclease [Phenylobacterium sp.]|nr:nuclease [Phenylobacterium sp.]
MAFFTYLLASAPYGTLYCGHTDTLTVRVSQHREKVFSGFTAKYGVSRLVWYEAHGERGEAFRRERQIKKWNRAWKVRLIEAENPTWVDLYEELVGWASEGPLSGLSLPEL